jgi:molybdopterin molybdotransferase
VSGVADARAAMLGAVAPLGAERVALAGACGRTLTAPVIASRAQPPFVASAMDGYALRASDAPGRLPVVGESAAGHAFARALGAHEAVRISTGAPLPLGADTVLIQEEARFEGDALIADALQPGRHVRAAGADFEAGAQVLAAGRRLDPIGLALAAAAGAAHVDVARQPRVSVLCAGDEIVAPGRSPRADQIFESCSFAVAAYAERWGAEVRRCAALADDPAAIEDAARAALGESDFVVFIGSASVGPHDHARPVFERLGARLLVRKVDMRPGKPTWFAATPRAPVLGLPGNPASAIVASVVFLRPLLERLQGGEGAVALSPARLAEPLPANGPREAFLRAHVSAGADGALWITPARDQDSSLLSVFAASNALLHRAANVAAAAAGDPANFVSIGACNGVIAPAP